MHSPPEFYTGSRTKVPSTYGEALSLTLRSSGPITSVVLIIGGATARVYMGAWHWSDLAAVVSVSATWPFVEWAAHKYLLHRKPLPLVGWRLPELFSTIHLRHHRDPWDSGTLHFKGGTILGAWLLMTSILTLLFTLRAALTFSSCFFLLVETYQWVHLLAHSKVRIGSPYLRKLVQNHIDHHAIDGQRWMGVTSLLADRVLGTGTPGKPGAPLA